MPTPPAEPWDVLVYPRVGDPRVSTAACHDALCAAAWALGGVARLAREDAPADAPSAGETADVFAFGDRDEAAAFRAAAVALAAGLGAPPPLIVSRPADFPRPSSTPAGAAESVARQRHWFTFGAYAVLCGWDGRRGGYDLVVSRPGPDGREHVVYTSLVDPALSGGGLTVDQLLAHLARHGIVPPRSLRTELARAAGA